MNSKMAICLLCAVAVATPIISRADQGSSSDSSTNEPTNWKQMYEEQKKRTDELEKRIGLLEEKDKNPPYTKTADIPENTTKFLKQVDISGFVSASYTYNYNRPADRLNGG